MNQSQLMWLHDNTIELISRGHFTAALTSRRHVTFPLPSPVLSQLAAPLVKAHSHALTCT